MEYIQNTLLNLLQQTAFLNLSVGNLIMILVACIFLYLAIESAHAIAYAMKLAPTMGKDKIIVVNVSGRGDKDCAAIARYRGEDIHE